MLVASGKSNVVRDSCHMQIIDMDDYTLRVSFSISKDPPFKLLKAYHNI